MTNKDVEVIAPSMLCGVLDQERDQIVEEKSEPDLPSSELNAALRIPLPIIPMKHNTAISRFSCCRSTEENFKCTEDEEDCHCFGAYGHLRSTLDYSYHCHYQKQRQWLHDSIIEDILESGIEGSSPTSNVDPWLIFTVGAQGAGKRYVMDHLIQTHRFSLRDHITVDVDEIRRFLPEYSCFIDKSPMLVDHLTLKEAGYIAETLTLAAIQQGVHVIFDCSLKSAGWYLDFIQKIRKEHPSMKVAMIHIKASLDDILKRNDLHHAITGRTIPKETILSQIESIPHAIEIVKPQVDHFFVIRNQDAEPELENVEWLDFTATFVEVCSIVKISQGIHFRADDEGKYEELKQQSAMDVYKKLRERRFSTLMSTEENHRSNDMRFYGQFAHIRKTLDYSYHSNYNFMRQIFQDAIIHDFLNAAILKDTNGEICTTPTEPWIVFTAGAMGAGKSYTIRKLVQKGRFPLLAFVVVDPDAIRRFLPEYSLYVDQAPNLAGDLTRKEAGYISEILTLAALQSGKNVMVDGSLRDSEWYKIYFARLRKEFPNLKLAILHVMAPKEAVFQRAKERARKTGRIVPEKLLEETLESVPKSVEVLAPLVDYRADLSNAPNAPDIEQVTPGETWDSFRLKWMQTCAWIPSKRLLKKISSNISEKSAALSTIS